MNVRIVALLELITNVFFLRGVTITTLLKTIPASYIPYFCHRLPCVALRCLTLLIIPFIPSFYQETLQ